MPPSTAPGRIGLALGLLAALAACDHAPRQAGEGIVSLAPAITETVHALEAGDRLIGRSDYDRYPAEVVALPPMGTALVPNFEVIARARPAVILTDASGHDHVDALSRIAPVEELPWLTLDDVTSSIRRLGATLDRREPAETLAERMRDVLGQPPADQAPSVLLAMEGADASQVWYLRRNSLHGRALHAAGGRNAVDRDVHAAAVLAPEELLAVDPEVIIIVAATGDVADVRAAAHERFAALTTLRAVRDGRIGAVVGARFLLPGPSILELVGRLRDEIDRVTP